MNAKMFYKSFRENFKIGKSEMVMDAYKDDRGLAFREWTDLMTKFLRKILSDMGFMPEKELRIAEGRLDHKWRKGDYAIFLEHENKSDVKAIMDHEVRNLLNSDGNLRVLIAYLGSEQKRSQLVDGVLLKLKREKRGRAFEFLLIIGRDEYMNSPDNWEAYVYRPTFECVPLKG